MNLYEFYEFKIKLLSLNKRNELISSIKVLIRTFKIRLYFKQSVLLFVWKKKFKYIILWTYQILDKGLQIYILLKKF